MALWDNLHLHELRHRLRPHLSACRNEAFATPRRTSYDQTSLCLYSPVFFTSHLFWRPISKTWRFEAPKILYDSHRGHFWFFTTAFIGTYPDQSDVRKTIVLNAPKHCCALCFRIRMIKKNLSMLMSTQTWNVTELGTGNVTVYKRDIV